MLPDYTALYPRMYNSSGLWMFIRIVLDKVKLLFFTLQESNHSSSGITSDFVLEKKTPWSESASEL
jgi:hypothetical protein